MSELHSLVDSWGYVVSKLNRGHLYNSKLFGKVEREKPLLSPESKTQHQTSPNHIGTVFGIKLLAMHTTGVFDEIPAYRT